MIRTLLISILFFTSFSYAANSFAANLLQIISLNSPAFIIEVPKNKALETILTDELTSQRATNLELKQFTRPNKIARYEKELLTKKLRSEGYYGATISVKTKDNIPVYRINAGQAYRIHSLFFDIQDDIKPPTSLPSLKQNSILKAQNVLDAQKELRNYLESNSCLYQIKIRYDATVHHANQSATLGFIVSKSTQVTVDNINFSGLKKLKEPYVEKIIPLASGDCFKRHQLNKIRLDLLQTNLLASVDIQVSEPKNEKVDILFSLSERKQRTVSAGVGYQNDDGLGVSAGWESRNLRGKAEKLSVDSRVYERNKSLSATLSLPHFYKKNQIISIYNTISAIQTDAYDSDTLSLGAEITRKVSQHTKVSVGGDLNFSTITENQETADQVALISLPLSFEYNKRNDIFNPTSGWVSTLRISPYQDWYEKETKFLKSTLSLSAYTSFPKWQWSPTLAARGALGSINNIEQDQVPANIRFYSGGGGSVRGYPYQSLGPKNSEGEPSGGLSYNEVSLEARMRWSESWGGVIFVDAGNAYLNSSPQIGDSFLWSTGIGLRFFTSFAPIRIDIAFPLDNINPENTNQEIDPFQLYINIGQAF